MVSVLLMTPKFTHYLIAFAPAPGVEQIEEHVRPVPLPAQGAPYALVAHETVPDAIRRQVTTA